MTIMGEEKGLCVGWRFGKEGEGERGRKGEKTYGIHDRYTTIIRTTRQLGLKSLCQEKPPFLK